MKKLLSLVIVGSLTTATLISGVTPINTFEAREVYAQTKDIKVVVDEKEIVFDQQPIMENGSVYVPMRAIFEALGFEVKWNDEFQAVESYTEKENYLITMALYQGNQMSVTYKEFKSDYTDLTEKGYRSTERLESETSTNFNFKKTFSPSYKIVNGRVLVPVRAISEGTGAEVKWDSATQTVIIDNTNPVITNRDTGESYEVNKAKQRVDDFFNNNTNIENEAKDETANSKVEVVDDAINREEVELEIVRLVNEERVKAGLDEVEVAEDLMHVARWHSDEMVELDYFSHMSPTLNMQHTELARNLGADYTYAGENAYAGSSSPEGIMTAWMGSAGHKKHILNPKVKYIGVGYTYDESKKSVKCSLFLGY